MWKKGGGRKTSQRRPLPKRAFGVPLVWCVFHPPPRCRCSVFPVQKSTTEQTRSSFGRVQKFSGGCALRYVFLPPSVLHPPPHIMAQIDAESCQNIHRIKIDSMLLTNQDESRKQELAHLISFHCGLDKSNEQCHERPCIVMNLSIIEHLKSSLGGLKMCLD